MKRLFAFMCMVMLLFSCAKASAPYLYMVNVGKGDAIIIQADCKNYLIDTGKAGAWDCLNATFTRLGITRLDAVFLTHTDKDHSGGLKKLAKSDIEIGAWYAAGLCPENRNDNPIVKAAEKRDAQVNWLYTGDTVDGIFTVIGPIWTDYDNEDNNSLVMVLDTGFGTVLLTGDMESSEELSIMLSGTDVTCDVIKIPNHADDDVCTAGLIEKTGARFALISTNPYEKPGTPDEYLISRLKNLDMDVYRTDFTGNGIRMDFTENGITVTVE